MPKKISFEENMHRLEQIVQAMERGDAPLEESLSLFQEGTALIQRCGILLEEAEKHELVLKDPAPFARLSKQNDSSLDFTMRVWVESKNYWTVNFDLLESLNNRFEAEGSEVPFNQLDVNIKK